MTGDCGSRRRRALSRRRRPEGPDLERADDTVRRSGTEGVGQLDSEGHPGSATAVSQKRPSGPALITVVGPRVACSPQLP